MATRLLVRNGVWKHYKGGHYRVLCESIHTETSERLVVYQCLYGKLTICSRPRDMFLGKVPGTKTPRFEYKL
jgi:hypothetical protein